MESREYTKSYTWKTIIREVKVVIDQDTCIVCGQCYSICPEVFQDDETGTAELVDMYQGMESSKENYRTI